MNIMRQRGLTTVEFAIIAASVMLVLFGVIEVARATFFVNVLNESTRRAARIAAVCPVNDPAITDVALFDAPGGGAARFGGLTAENVAIEYLDGNGDVIADPIADFMQIRFVRARIVNYQHRMLIPFANQVFTTPEFATTVRRESLGVPRTGPVVPC